MIEKKNLVLGKKYYTCSVSFLGPTENRRVEDIDVSNVIRIFVPTEVTYTGSGYYFSYTDEEGKTVKTWRSPGELYATMNECIERYNEMLEGIIEKIKEYPYVIRQLEKKKYYL